MKIIGWVKRGKWTAKFSILPSLACGAFGGVNENPFCDCWLRFCGWLWFVLGGNVNDVFGGVCNELNEWSGKSWSYREKTFSV